MDIWSIYTETQGHSVKVLLNGWMLPILGVRPLWPITGQKTVTRATVKGIYIHLGLFYICRCVGGRKSNDLWVALIRPQCNSSSEPFQIRKCQYFPNVLQWRNCLTNKCNPCFQHLKEPAYGNDNALEWHETRPTWWHVYNKKGLVSHLLCTFKEWCM